MPQRFPTLIFAGVIGLLSSCMHAYQPQAVSSDQASQVSYQLFLSRTSLEGTDFEQYKLLPMGLFMECGTIRRGRSHSSEHDIVRLQPDALQSTQVVAAEIFQHMTGGDPPSADSPGNNSSLIDPGKFLLSVTMNGKTARVDTSLDYVQRDKTMLSEQAKKFAQLLRGSLQRSPCGLADFYGIGAGR